MKQLSLRICRTNLERFSLPDKEWAAQGCGVECLDCLAQCGDCEAGPFVEVDGNFVFADDLAGLAKSMELIRQEA